MKMFQVGGAVRDELLGRKSKDIDFTVVLEGSDLNMRRPARIDDPYTPIAPFKIMVDNLKALGFKVWLETPEFLTARAMFPKGHEHEKQTADFVLARRESDYTDGRRPDVVEPGTLFDDLNRRDLTMNAIAKDDEGNFIDPHFGRMDIRNRIIRTVGRPEDRFSEDPLRILRAARFAVTLEGFTLDSKTFEAMLYLRNTVSTVSTERVREEITKMFSHDTIATLDMLDMLGLTHVVFSMGIKLMPTTKKF